MSTSDSPGSVLTVFVNDRPHALGAPATVSALIDQFSLAGRRGIAVAVNGTVVPRVDWAGRLLAAGDRVVVIQATQGG